MKIYDNSNMVLRYYIGLKNTEKRFKNLVKFLKETGIHRVVLFSSAFVGESSIISKEYYREHSLMLKPYVERLREMGVDVGINFLYTIGHAYYADEKEFGFKRAVCFDGSKSRGCVCNLDENWLKYVKEIYGYYAELKPSVIFYDDDIRATSLGQITCLCDEHIKLLSKRIGRTVTADDVRKAVLSTDFEASDLKKAFFEQTKERIETIMREIAYSIHKISPETDIGIMTIPYPDMTIDRDLGEFFGNNKARKINKIRTGMNYYREESHKDIPLAFSSPAIQREFINDSEIEIQPEIENDIYGLFYKSNAITKMQISWCLTNGIRNCQLNIFDMIDADPCNFDEITDSFTQNMPFYNAVCELIPENSKTCGVNIFASPTALQNRRAKDGNIGFVPEWYKYLQVDGIPLGYGIDKADFLLLTGDDIASLSNDEIDSMLKKGAVIDLDAAEILVHKGFAGRIGIEKIGASPLNFVGEEFTNHALNGEFKNCHNSHYFYKSLYPDYLVSEIVYNEKAEILSHIVNHRGEKVADFFGVYENENGERFAILPMAHNIFTQFMNICNKRKYQLINVFEWIARKELPVYCHNEMVCTNINRFENYNVITLFNISSDEIKTPKIAYRAIGELKFVDENGELASLEYEKQGRDIIIQKPMKSIDVLIIVDGK